MPEKHESQPKVSIERDVVRGLLARRSSTTISNAGRDGSKRQEKDQECTIQLQDSRAVRVYHLILSLKDE